MKKTDYEQFAGKKCQELIQIQERFRAQFELGNYQQWYYDAELALLRLYNNDEDQIYLKYIPIGTFSFTSDTWMWSWFNEHSVEPNKGNILAVKDFGIKNNYTKLTEGTFPADEFDCWEFAAISLDMLDGMGLYRVSTEKLQSYFLITAVLDENSRKVVHFNQAKVTCKIHGLSRPAFICQHLDLKNPKGFEESFDTYKGMELDEEDDFAAWCDECERVRMKYNGWNEDSEEFAKIKLVCEDCYFELKDFNKAE